MTTLIAEQLIKMAEKRDKQSLPTNLGDPPIEPNNEDYARITRELIVKVRKMAALLKLICKVKVEKGWHKGGECNCYVFLKEVPESISAETGSQGSVSSLEE